MVLTRGFGGVRRGTRAALELGWAGQPGDPEGLEGALRAEEPRLHARLRDMRPAGLTAWQVVLGLLSGVGLGLGLTMAGTVAALPVLRWIGVELTVAAPSLALVWWVRRYYCRYCAGRWPAPDPTCPRCERPVPA